MAIHIDIIPILRDREVRREADRLANEFDSAGARASDKFGDAFARGIGSQSPKIQRALNSIENATARVTAAQLTYTEAQNRGNVSSARMAVLADRIATARRNEADAHRSAGAAIRTAITDVEKLETAAKGAGNIIQELGQTAFRTGRGMLSIAAPIAIDGLIQIAEVGTAATQALWLLPAAAAAAGAGIGTLAMATHGFGQAIKDMGDPKKWAQDLQALSPAAQQAALEIKHLVDGPLGALQNATQEAFFKGLPEQIDRLVTTYLPTIQTMTTGIADAFNKMMTGVGNQLMTPETQSSMSTLMNNITLAFQNLAPAAAPFTKALTDIAAAGSDFLPGLATSITNAANSFATFISNARESGQLHVWIQQGIDAVGNLASALGEIVKIWYHVFGPEAKSATDSNIVGVSALKETVGSYGADLRKISDIFGLLMADGDAWAAKWNEEMVSMQGPLGAFRDMILDIPEAMATAFNGVKHVIDGMMTNLVNDMNHIADILPDAANEKLFGTAHPKPFSFTPAADAPVGDWAGYQDTRGIFGNDQTGGQTPLGGTPNAQRNRRGAPSITDNNAPGIGQFPVPPPPPDTSGGKPSDKERRDAIIAGLDPKTWQVDPFAGMPPALPIGAQGGPGAMSNQDFIEGQRNIIEKAHALEEATKARLALEKDNQATAQDISEAKWKEVQDGWNLQEEQQKLVDKMRGTTSATKSGMEDLGAALDPDLGLGKGLSGLADNLVRFLGNAALAGPMAELNKIKNDNEAATGIQGGYGLLGIQGAKNLAAGNSPLLGNPLGNGTGTPTGYGSVPSYGTGVNTTGATMPTFSAQPGQSPRDFAHNTMQPFWQSMGLRADDHAADNYGEHQNGALDIMVPNLQKGQEVLQQVLSDPNVYGAIFNKQSYGYGHGATPKDYTGPNPHTDHVHAWYKPGDPNNINPGGTPMALGAGSYSSAGWGGGSIPIPLPVTIVGAGGGGGGLAGLFGGGGGGGGAGAAAAFGGGGGGGGKSLWDSVAQAESSGNWFNNDTGGNGHFGGLQFSPSTWKAYGGTGMPNEATREQQIEIANRAAFTGYNGTPPQGLSAWQAITDGKVPGVTTGTPAAAFSGGGGQSPILKQWQPGVGGGLANGGSNPDSFAGLGGNGNVGGTKQDPNPNWFNGLLFGDPPPRNNIPLAGSKDMGLVGGWGPPGLPNQAAPGSIGGIPVPASVAGAAGPLDGPPTTNGAPGGIGTAPTVGGRPPAGPTGIGTGLNADMANPTTIGGLAPPAPNPSGGGVGITPGGTLDTAMNLAASAFPGVGQAAATGMKLASRAIQYGGQMAGIGVEGLMQTFLPTGGSELANNSWLTRIVGGLAGASPALPNLAGGKGGGGQPPGATPQPPLTPDQAQPQQPGLGGALGGQVNNNITVNNQRATEDGTGRDVAAHLNAQNFAPMGGMGTPR